MIYACSVCQRTFEAPGFCPFDGCALAESQGSPIAAAQPTVVSTAMAAQRPTEIAGVDRHVTDVERRGTFPMTPTPPASRETQEVTAARTRPGAVATPTPPPRDVRALSASEDPRAALASYLGPHPSEYDKLVGQTLDGRYFVEKKIGEGGMGVVFAARHAVIERPLAIKVLKREVMRDTATIKRFVQEAKAASRIGHPNIVDVTDFGTTPDGMTYSVMEYVDGQTLGTALRHGAPFTMHRAIRIAVQIARALGAAHDKGIVHRDLKPENVFLLDRDNRPDFVKIVDFGIAKVAPVAGTSAHEPRLTRAGSVFGTPEYMAPEQAAGKSDTDGRVDVYALGIILYEMLTGKVPHRGDTMVRTLAMQMLDIPDPPRRVRPDLEITEDLEQVVLKALAKKREQRYQSMGALVEALEKLQVPVGLSVTGSPVYALTPLPPGADPRTEPMPGLLAGPPMPRANKEISAQGNLATPVSARTEPRSRAPTNRLRDEPQFVTRDKPITFEHVFTGETPLQGRRRWPYVVLLALLLGGAAGVTAFAVRKRAKATTPPDAGLALLAPDAADPDASAVIVVTADDAPPAPDATDIVVVVDAGPRIAVRPRDAGAGSAAVLVANGRGVSIQVLTKPEGATLYNHTTYTGPGGTNIEMPFGSKAEITCRSPGYKPGKVQLVFDGTMEVALCALTRIKICIDNIKNPFDDCEIDPTKPIPPPGTVPASGTRP